VVQQAKIFGKVARGGLKIATRTSSFLTPRAYFLLQISL
jgi:hypothetical protein